MASAPLRRAMILMLGGSSLTNGRLATPPYSWDQRLLADMEASPECKGEVIIINTGLGNSTSTYGAQEAEIMAPLRPTHVLMEDWGINDCVPGNAISLTQARGNFYDMVDSYRSYNPDVIITHQTMSSASAADVNRTNLAAYYNAGLVNAANRGILSLNHYPNWPKPLPPALTVDADGLHPLWDAAFEIYSYPLILSWARQAMSDFWGSAKDLITESSLPLITQSSQQLVAQG